MPSGGSGFPGCSASLRSRSRPCFGPRGIHLNHAGSHSRLPSPRTMKTGRQPKRAISTPPASVPRAGPHVPPAWISAFAKSALVLGEVTGQDLRITRVRPPTLPSPEPTAAQPAGQLPGRTRLPLSRATRAGSPRPAPSSRETVHQPAGDNLEHRVGPEESGKQNTQLRCGDAQLRFEQRRRDGEVRAVDVIDGDGQDQSERGLSIACPTSFCESSAEGFIIWALYHRRGPIATCWRGNAGRA